MTKKIKGDLSVSASGTSNSKNIITSINNVNADSTGNISVLLPDLISGTTGNTIIFDENNTAIARKSTEFVNIINSDDDLAYIKTLVSTTNSRIYDTRTGAVWVYTTSWNIDPSLSLVNELDKGVIYSNTNTGISYFINSDGSVSTIAGTSIGTGVGEVPSMSSFTSTNTYQKLPSGFIIQYVSGTSNTSGVMTITLPIPFPNAILGGIAEEINPVGWTEQLTTIWAFSSALSNQTTASAIAKQITATGVTSVQAGGKIIVWGY